MKIKCKTLNAGCDARSYKGPSGKPYDFSLGHYTEVADPEDALSFLNAGEGKYFEAEKPFEEATKALKAAVKKLLKQKEVDEENPPEETGALEPNEEDLEAVDGDAPVDAEEPGEDKEPEEDPEEVVTEESFTHDGLKGLNAKQQTYLIKQVQGDDASIPRYEKQRIELLLKLQEEGAKLVEILKGYQL